MRNLPFVSIITALLFMIVLCGGIAVAEETSQQPLLPHAFYGTVEVAGQPAEAGIRVEARAEGIMVDVTGNPIYTHEGGYGGFGGMNPKILVQGSIGPGAPIEFLVGGVVAEVYDVKAQRGWNQSYPFTSGEVTELNLRISTQVTPEGTAVAAGATTSPTAQITVTTTQAASKSSVPGVSPGVTQVVTQPAKVAETVSAPATSGGSSAGTDKDTGGQSPEPDTGETAAPGTTGQSFSYSWITGAALIIIIIIGGAAYLASRKKVVKEEEKAEVKIIEEPEETEENTQTEETEKSEDSEENK